MTISVKMLARSIGPGTPVLTTMELYYPRIIHAEFLTHRVMSRNSGSSRAAPVVKMLDRLRQDMFIPKFRKNKPGMQPGELLTEEEQVNAERIWQDMALKCMEGVERLAEMGVHKQWANRPLEWFGHIKVVASATDWKNFFELRKDVDEHMRPFAQDEFYELAKMTREAMNAVEPKRLNVGEWHLPYVDTSKFFDWERTDVLDELIKVSVARCARTSYSNLDDTPPEMSKDIALFDKLVGSSPLHASPTEHQATPDTFTIDDFGCNKRWKLPHLSGNFSPGWIQYRKTLPGEWVPG